MTPILDYFYGNQTDQFTFYRIPKLLFTSPEYRNISAEAKILYGLLLDRMTLSARSGWVDEFNRVFIIFTIGDIMEALGCATQKAAKLLSELEEKAGLIERRRQGLGKPNIIYVKNFVTEESKIKNCENQNSGVLKIENQEFPESKSNNTDKNNTDINDTDSLLFPSVRGDQRREAARCDAKQREEYRKLVLENIEYEILESSPGTDHISDVVFTPVDITTPFENPSAPELQADEPEFPDPLIRTEDMQSFGYLDEDMLPLSKDRALELLEQNVPIYLLYYGNTEAMALDEREIIEHASRVFSDQSARMSTDGIKVAQKSDRPFAVGLRRVAHDLLGHILRPAVGIRTHSCMRCLTQRHFVVAGTQHIQTLADKALYVTDDIPEYGTRLLTLSTCYGGGSDSRLIVVAAVQ